MSGVAGGDRILKKDVMDITNSYIKILREFPKFVTYKLSGSLSSSNKIDFGDIDLIIQFNGDNKKEIKKELIEFLTSLPNDIILPFKSDKYKNKRYYNSGEIITILFPQSKNKCIQIDNIICLSPDEMNFKKEFLDLPAEKQGLFLGLIKTILIENTLEKVFPYMNSINTNLNKNQEFEFNLSSSKLELRKVDLDDNYKTLKKEVVWKSTNWNYVKKLLLNYKIESSFEELLNDIKLKLKHERSFNRLVGLFNSMVSVKSGEKGTLKGDQKLYAKKLVENLLT